MTDDKENAGKHSFHREGREIIFDPPPDPIEVARKQREDEQHEFARSQVNSNKRIAWFNGLLVFATLCTIGVGWWQGIISRRSADAAQDAVDLQDIQMRHNRLTEARQNRSQIESLKQTQKQFEDMLCQIKAQTKAQQTSSSAAQSVAKTADESLRAVQRAFVYPVPSWTQRNWQDGKPNGISLDVVWKNNGETPAQDFRLTQSFYDRKQQGSLKTRDPDFMGKQMHLVVPTPKNPYIPPKAEFTSHIINVDQQSLEDVGRGNEIMFWGDAEYSDVFQGTPKHITKFCYLIISQSASMMDLNHPVQYDLRFNQCPTHNCIDEQCKTK